MKETYITRAILKDYLTIKEVDITFNKDINIIIGQNGTGKTNFINYLNDTLTRIPQLPVSNSSIDFLFKNKNYQKDITISKAINKDLTFSEKNEILLLRNRQKVITRKEEILTSLVATLVSHGIPQFYDVAKESFNGSILKITGGSYMSFINNNKSTLVSSLGYIISPKLFLKERQRTS